MTTDRSTVLRTAAAARTTATAERARRALLELDRRGEPISLARVAAQAGVSRQFLYDHADLRAEINRRRGDQTSAAPASRIERASDESSRVRLQAALDEHKRLRAEIARLREELALAHGRVRELELAAGRLRAS